MDRREALAKATITTTDASAGLLDPTQGASFVRKLKEKGVLAPKLRQEIRTASSGEINKVATGSRIIRAATENADDGYRAGATFSTVNFVTQKVRLPWEVTEDVFHENIEGEGFESTLVDEMTTQFGLDMEDLEINGDTASGNAFIQINDGIIKQVVTANVAGRNINGSTINGGVFSKAHYFEALQSMPNIYRTSPNLVWIMSPNRKLQWWESITDLANDSGQGLLLGNNPLMESPLGKPILTPPSWPDDTVFLADPRNFVRVISWQVRKRKVTGETDAELAALDKRFYIYFIKHDVVIEETDAVVRIHTLTAP
jgi:HK97 family phage major capsid protein